MADDGEINGERLGESEQVVYGGEFLNTECASKLHDSVCAILTAIEAFSTELNLGADVLKIDTDSSRINVSSVQPAHLQASVQQHIIKLQALSANLRHLIKTNAMEALQDGARSEDSRGDGGTVGAGAATGSETLSEGSAAGAEGKRKRDDSHVQIRASKSEIDRRISAFIERKQLEINENNVREFCNVIDCNQENSCARTDAVFTPYPGYKSHVRVTRVVNTYGPQTRAVGSREAGEQKRAEASGDCGNPAIEERLHNMETHLKLPTAGPVPSNVYLRLKQLEDRILELEGLSPEYFQSMAYLHKRPNITPSQAYSLTELDGKISALKATLLKKASEFRTKHHEEFTL